LKSKSVPDADFGKAITSRIDDVLHKIAIKRSNPVEKEKRAEEWTELFENQQRTLQGEWEKYVPKAIPP